MTSSFSLRSTRTIAVLAIGQLIGWGTTFDMLGVLGRVVAPDLGIANEVAFLGLSVMMLVSAIAGPLTGRLLTRFGASRVLAGGSVTMACGLLILSSANGVVLYGLAWCVIGFGGALGLSTGAYTAIVEREGANAGRIIAILMLFTGLSSATFWPLQSFIEGLIGWRMTFLVDAGAQLCICLPLHLFALPKPQAIAVESEATDDIAPVSLPVRGERHAFVLIAATTAIVTFLTYGLTSVLLPLLGLFGASPAFALQLGSLRGVMGISARFVDMLLGRRSSPLLSFFMGTVLLFAVFILPMVWTLSPAGLVLFVVLYGFGSGVATVARAILPLVVFSRRNFGLQSARLSLPQNLASAAAPVIFTAILDRAGSDWLMAVCAGAATLSLFLIAMLVKLVRQGRSQTAAA